MGWDMNRRVAEWLANQPSVRDKFGPYHLLPNQDLDDFSGEHKYDNDGNVVPTPTPYVPPLPPFVWPPTPPSRPPRRPNRPRRPRRPRPDDDDPMPYQKRVRFNPRTFKGPSRGRYYIKNRKGRVKRKISKDIYYVKYIKRAPKSFYK